MRCETVRKLLDAYAEGNLDGKKAKSLAEHLGSCSNCLNQWREVQKLHWLLSDAFADFHPVPSPDLEHRIGQAIAAQRLPMSRRVVALRSQAIFAVTTVALICVIAAFLHQPSPLTDVPKVETATKVEKAGKPVSLTRQLQKPEKRTETVTMTTVKKPDAKRRAISLKKENVKVAATFRRGVETLKAVTQTGRESRPREDEQPAAPHELSTESLPEIATEPRTVLVRIERIVSHNPVEPVPEIFVYRPLNSPAIQEVKAPMLQGAIVQPVTVAEIPVPSPIRP